MLCLRRLTFRCAGCTLRPPGVCVLLRLGYSEWPERPERLERLDVRRWDRVSVCARVDPSYLWVVLHQYIGFPGFGKGNGAFFNKN